jgi:hypothetical protein
MYYFLFYLFSYLSTYNFLFYLFSYLSTYNFLCSFILLFLSVDTERQADRAVVIHELLSAL